MGSHASAVLTPERFDPCSQPCPKLGLGSLHSLDQFLLDGYLIVVKSTTLSVYVRANSTSLPKLKSECGYLLHPSVRTHTCVWVNWYWKLIVYEFGKMDTSTPSSTRGYPIPLFFQNFLSKPEALWFTSPIRFVCRYRVLSLAAYQFFIFPLTLQGST